MIKFDELSESDVLNRKLHKAIRILLVVATEVEFKAAISWMRPLPGSETISKFYGGDQTYYVGTIGCFPICLVKTTMMGSLKRDSSFSTVTDALYFWKLKIVIMPGIAFGRDENKQSIGDILISETLSQYETVKEDKGAGTITRGHSVPASTILLNRFSQESYWIDPDTKARASVVRCELLSGEKLVNDNSTKTRLFERFPNAKGGEMEGNGVYAACDKKKVDWIICKSICDWGDGEKNDDWQTMAARNAVGFVEHILSNRTAFEELDVTSIFSDELDGLFYGEKPDYKNILGLDIVRIIFPKHEIREYQTISIPKERIYYEYLVVKINDNLKVGYLFFAKRINQDKTIKHFLANQTDDYDSLSVCSPRVKSVVSGRDDYRLASLESKFQAHDKYLKREKVEFCYIEDLVWDHCLARYVLSLNYDIPDEKYFIDQEIISINQDGKEVEEKSLSYFNSILTDELRAKPLIAVLGSAGVGKTTLCDQIVKFISLQKKKKAIYISSSDIDVHDGTNDVRTVTDLYRLSYTSTIEDDEQLFDPANLEVNISCGNIILIIDGLDEIEAKLKDRFNFDAFIRDAVNLNESYNNCTIIVTSRDYYKSKYENNSYIELLSLFGFDNELAQRYFSKRLSKNLVDKAARQLRGLNIADDGHYPPVILSLVCDTLESEEEIENKGCLDDRVNSKYLFAVNAFDALIIKLIDREIKRQSLNMAIDDVVDVLFEIVSCEKGEILKTYLNEYLKLYEIDNIDSTYSSFYTNPLLRSTHNNENVGFRYDNLLLILRSRYFNYCVGHNLNNSSFIKSALLEFYDGKGDLLIDILSNNSYPENVILNSTTILMGQFINERDEHIHARNRRDIDKNKKYISAMLYYFFGCFPDITRTERSDRIKSIYSGEVRCLFVYDDFYALDFRVLKIKDSGFYDYGKFEKSIFPLNQKVFFGTEFKGIAPKANLNADMNLFDETCRINNRLKHAIVKGEENKDDFLQLIKADFVTIFGVLYKNRMFVKKSENIFRHKKGKLYPKLAVEDFLSFFLESGVFEREKTHGSSSSKYHYYVSKKYKDDVRYLLTNNNFRKELEIIFKRFLFKQFGVE